jgi:beta-galactosidase
MIGDGRDAQPVTIRAVDARGRTVPDAACPVLLAAQGIAQIGVCNGNPIGPQIDKSERICLFNGLAQVIVRTIRNSAGQARLLARSDGLRSGIAALDIVPGLVPAVPAPRPTLQLREWRQTQLLDVRPSPGGATGIGDANSTTPVSPGRAVGSAPQDGFVLITAKVDLNASMVRTGALLRFKAIAGSADVWVDERRVATKEKVAPAPLEIALAPGEPHRRIAVVLRAIRGQPYGLPGGVTVEPPN